MFSSKARQQLPQIIGFRSPIITPGGSIVSPGTRPIKPQTMYRSSLRPPQISHKQCAMQHLSLCHVHAESALVRRIHLSFPNPVFIRGACSRSCPARKKSISQRAAAVAKERGDFPQVQVQSGGAHWAIGAPIISRVHHTVARTELPSVASAEHKRTRLSVFVWECVPPQYKSRTGTVGDREFAAELNHQPPRAQNGFAPYLWREIARLYRKIPTTMVKV